VAFSQRQSHSNRIIAILSFMHVRQGVLKTMSEDWRKIVSKYPVAVVRCFSYLSYSGHHCMLASPRVSQLLLLR